MNVIVDRPQLVRVALLYLNKNFGNLTPKTNSKYPNSVFYVDSDNEVMMEYNKKNDEVYIHYERIWSKIESLFSLEYDDIQSIMKIWLERDYNLRNLKLVIKAIAQFESWREITILNDI
jgi:hypothetical protein